MWKDILSTGARAVVNADTSQPKLISGGLTLIERAEKFRRLGAPARMLRSVPPDEAFFALPFKDQLHHLAEDIIATGDRLNDQTIQRFGTGLRDFAQNLSKGQFTAPITIRRYNRVNEFQTRKEEIEQLIARILKVHALDFSERYPESPFPSQSAHLVAQMNGITGLALSSYNSIYQRLCAKDDSFLKSAKGTGTKPHHTESMFLPKDQYVYDLLARNSTVTIPEIARTVGIAEDHTKRIIKTLLKAIPENDPARSILVELAA